jgi:hypothetical protein
MPRRSSRSLRISFFAALAIAASAVATADCGPGRFEGVAGGLRDTGAQPDPVEAGVDARGAVAACRQSCQNAHLEGVTPDRDIERCIEEECVASCDTREPARLATEQDGAAEAATACAVEIDEFSAACNTCIRARCCKQWSVCYAEAGTPCDLLDECYERCPE